MMSKIFKLVFRSFFNADESTTNIARIFIIKDGTRVWNSAEKDEILSQASNCQLQKMSQTMNVHVTLKPEGRMKSVVASIKTGKAISQD